MSFVWQGFAIRVGGGLELGILGCIDSVVAFDGLDRYFFVSDGMSDITVRWNMRIS